MDMDKIKIGTFNVENLFMRYNFNENINIEDFLIRGGPRTWLKAVLSNSKPIGNGQTKNTAKVILANDPHIIALQEVEDMNTLKQFNSKFLKGMYPYAILIDSSDPRFIDVAILSKYPISYVRTHQFDKDDNGELIFSRDCLEADIMVDGKTLTLFVNHFKSKYRDNPAKRKKQAERVAQIVRDRFGNSLSGNFVVLGDFNDTPDSDALNPLLSIGLENVVQTRIDDPNERWTHAYKSKPSQLDYILLSPELTEHNRDEKPYIERRGLGKYITIYQGPRFPGVGPEGTEASDHCAVFMNLSL
jgi:endonuclease/exonuclease/phosphatase family metal-dependent hydrolase